MVVFRFQIICMTLILSVPILPAIASNDRVCLKFISCIC